MRIPDRVQEAGLGSLASALPWTRCKGRSNARLNMAHPRRAAHAPASIKSECSAFADADMVGAFVARFEEGAAGTGFDSSTPNDVSTGPVVTTEDDLTST